MRRTPRAMLFAVLIATGQGGLATESRSLDDRPWQPMTLDAPFSWFSVRWEAERVNHVLDILAELGGCTCEKAIAILETDLRKYQSALEREVKRIQEAESRGKVVNEWIVLVDQKPGKVVATEVQQRVRQYWSSRRPKSNATPAN